MHVSLVSAQQHVLDSCHDLLQFRRSIAPKGWVIHGRTANDGNCLFWAISDQLDDELTQAELRRRVIEHMKTLSEVSKLFVLHYIL